MAASDQAQAGGVHGSGLRSPQHFSLDGRLRPGGRNLPRAKRLRPVEVSLRTALQPRSAVCRPWGSRIMPLFRARVFCWSFRSAKLRLRPTLARRTQGSPRATRREARPGRTLAGHGAYGPQPHSVREARLTMVGRFGLLRHMRSLGGRPGTGARPTRARQGRCRPSCSGRTKRGASLARSGRYRIAPTPRANVGPAPVAQGLKAEHVAAPRRRQQQAQARVAQAPQEQCVEDSDEEMESPQLTAAAPAEGEGEAVA